MSRRLRLAAVATTVAAALLVSACGGGDDTAGDGAGSGTSASMSVAEVANLTGPDRTQKLIDQAKAEGEIMIYTSMDTEEVEEFVQAFKDAYPDLKDLKVQSYRAGEDELTQRIDSEYKAKRYAADVVTYGSPEIEGLGEAVYQPYVTPEADKLDATAKSGLKVSYPTKAQAFLMAYNKEKVPEGQVPTSYDQLLAGDTWKGKFAVEASDDRWLGALLQVWGEEKTKSTFGRMKELGVKAQKGHTQLTQLIAAGQYPIGLTNYIGTINEINEEHDSVGYKVFDPLVVKYNGVALPKNSAHPAASMLFIDFMLGDVGQKLISSKGDVPVRDGVEGLTLSQLAGGATIAPIDAATLAQSKTVEPLWNEYVLR